MKKSRRQGKPTEGVTSKWLDEHGSPKIKKRVRLKLEKLSKEEIEANRRKCYDYLIL